MPLTAALLEFLQPGAFALNVLFALLVTRVLYGRNGHNPDLLFSLLMFSVVIYLLVRVLAGADLGLGVGFGLFAVFALLRYRTGSISTRDLTYLFVVVGVALINALAVLPLLGLLPVNLIVLLALMAAQSRRFAAPHISFRVDHRGTELLRPERRAELLNSLAEQSGLDIVDVRILTADYRRDRAELQVTYRLRPGERYQSG